MASPLLITILMDNERSWFVPYANTLQNKFAERGHTVRRVARAADLPEGDCSFFFSVEHVIPPEFLARHMHNIVVHGSALPHGKGWSPLTWQVIEGKSEITVTLFEAAQSIDSGVIYDQEIVRFDGSELIDELREKEAGAIVSLVLRFVDAYPPKTGRAQEGAESLYPRRTSADSELDPTKSLIELFDQLRVADNERYPAFFKHRGHTYILKIFKKEE